MIAFQVSGITWASGLQHGSVVNMHNYVKLCIYYVVMHETPREPGAGRAD